MLISLLHFFQLVSTFFFYTAIQSRDTSLIEILLYFSGIKYFNDQTLNEISVRLSFLINELN